MFGIYRDHQLSLVSLCVLLILSISQKAASSNLLFNVSASGAAANLNITLCLNAKGPLSCANLTVLASNLNISPSIPNHVYPAMGIKVNTPGYVVSGCTPIANGYCLFSASSIAPASINVSSTSVFTVIASTGENGSISPSGSMVVNDGSNLVYTATPNAGYAVNQWFLDGSLAQTGGSTYQLTNITANHTVDVTFSATSMNAVAYIANFGLTPETDNLVTVCSITSGGALQGCATASDSTFSNPAGIASATIAGQAILYVANQGNSTLSICQVASDGIQGSCSVNSNVAIHAPSGISLNSAQTYLYLPDGLYNNVAICELSAGGLTLENCTVAADSSFARPTSIAFNPNGTYAYVTNGNNSTVSICPVTNSGASFSSCTAVNGFNTFNVSSGISLNALGTKAYILNQNNNTVSVCSLSMDGSTFLSCQEVTDPSFNFSGYANNDLSISTLNGVAYIPNTGNNTVSVCPINSDGLFDTCSITDSGLFYDPNAVTIINFSS